MAKKDVSKNEVNLTTMEYFLSDVFNNYLITKNHVETKINWLLGISGVIMGALIPLIINNNPAVNRLAILIICFSAVICFLICLLSFELPEWILNKPHRDGSVMFYNTKKTVTPEDIHEQLMNIHSREDILKQYSINIYNVVERNIKVKNKLFKGACNILFAGLFIGFVILTVVFFV